MELITIPKKEYECLRGHLFQAVEIFNSLGVEGGEKTPEKPFKKNPLKTSMKELKKEFSQIIGSGKKAGKPAYLKKNPM